MNPEHDPSTGKSSVWSKYDSITQKTISTPENYGDLGITETSKTAWAILSLTSKQTLNFIVIFIKLILYFTSDIYLM
jgi:hypothetical protein